ncbi:hypothetical protein KI387_011811, partial [Taxus chinensis]
MRALVRRWDSQTCTFWFRTGSGLGHPGFLGCQQQWELLIMDSGDGGLIWPLGIQGDLQIGTLSASGLCASGLW